MNKKPDLGQGIRALLQNMDSSLNNEAALLGTSNTIPLDQIEVNPFQPRHDFNEQALQELANSIRVHGIVQPITVRKIGARKYQLIAGERRVRAAKFAGLAEIPSFIRSADDEQMLEMALIENTHREDLNAIEVAINYKRLIDECNLKQEDLAEKVGKDRTTVTNYLRLLKLPPEIQTALKSKVISMAHARALIGIEDPVVQLHLYKEISGKELSVRQTEELARGYTGGNKRTEKKSATLPHAYQRLQEKMASHLSTKVLIKRKRLGKGDIIIQFYSDGDLDRLSELLSGE
ncbi:MAG TPA: ParB/RepB/Spo0J family partition protein [Chitinophagales bacterium]|nr:ParB/RepB/Spo0J family partition protein [Chitinophagales bacterium]